MGQASELVPIGAREQGLLIYSCILGSQPRPCTGLEGDPPAGTPSSVRRSKATPTTVHNPPKNSLRGQLFGGKCPLKLEKGCTCIHSRRCQWGLGMKHPLQSILLGEELCLDKWLARPSSPSGWRPASPPSTHGSQHKSSGFLLFATWNHVLQQ